MSFSDWPGPFVNGLGDSEVYIYSSTILYISPFYHDSSYSAPPPPRNPEFPWNYPNNATAPTTVAMA